MSTTIPADPCPDTSTTGGTGPPLGLPSTNPGRHTRRQAHPSHLHGQHNPLGGDQTEGSGHRGRRDQRGRYHRRDQHGRRGRSRRRAGVRRARPGHTPLTVLLWRWRHLFIALTTGLAVIVILSVLVPQAPDQREVLILARPVQAGQILVADDLERARLPEAALPDGGLADESALGRRAAIPLEPGTVLTTSMTSASLAVGVGEGERVVQVPVAVGAGLAQAGALVDLVAPREWVAANPARAAEPEPMGEAVGAGGTGQAEQVVLCGGARVLLTQPADESDGTWLVGRGATGGGAMVTLVTLAVPMDAAPVIVGVATHGALGLVLSP